MCECGCGDFQPRAKFPAPDGEWYALEIYGGCEDCHIGPGIVIHRMSATEAKRWDVQKLPNLPWREYGFPVAREAAESAVTILESKDLVAQLEVDHEGLVAAEEITERSLRFAIHKTLGAWPRKSRRRRNA